MTDKFDIVVVGGGAAGLMAAISAARANPRLNILILDGAKKLGAKILVAGGGRCNVTHYQVSETDYAGATPNSIKKILRRFDVQQVIQFFEALGVKLKQEDTGKLFPVSDSARTVLNALLSEVECLNIKVQLASRVELLSAIDNGFKIEGLWGNVSANKVILATGGKSLPKTGSDGGGYVLAKSLKHHLTENVFPALVPLLLPKDFFVSKLSGLTLPVVLKVVAANDKVLAEFEDSMLCTHFGLSGPVVLDISRYWLNARRQDKQVQLKINWLPEMDTITFDALFLKEAGRKTVRNFLKQYLSTRLVEQLCEFSGIGLDAVCDQLKREERKCLIKNIVDMPLPVAGDRGFTYAEVTAGGVPLTEINLKTMMSRMCDNLFLCGEICDVDGRIGGFNFQWAWASGYVAGIAASETI